MQIEKKRHSNDVFVFSIAHDDWQDLWFVVKMTQLSHNERTVVPILYNVMFTTQLSTSRCCVHSGKHGKWSGTTRIPWTMILTLGLAVSHSKLLDACFLMLCHTFTYILFRLIYYIWNHKNNWRINNKPQTLSESITMSSVLGKVWKKIDRFASHFFFWKKSSKIYTT